MNVASLRSVTRRKRHVAHNLDLLEATPMNDQTCDQRERGSEWEPIKILLEGDDYSNKTNTANQITSLTQLLKLEKST
jgi:hypothetical protein